METKLADGKTINEKKEHSKYKNKDYVRVTTAIRSIAKDERLTIWSINKFKTYQEYGEYMRQAAERGSRVDNAVKMLLKGQNLPQDATLGLEGYIGAFEKFRSTWGILATSMDEEVSDEEWKLVGTLDICGTLSNGSVYEDAVVDIKTGSPTRDKEGKKVYEVYEEMHWQTAAYRKMKGAKSNWILRLFDDGEYKLEQDTNYERSLEFVKHGAAIAHLKKCR